MEIQSKMKYHCIPVRMANKILKILIVSDVEKQTIKLGSLVNNYFSKKTSTEPSKVENVHTLQSSNSTSRCVP